MLIAGILLIITASAQHGQDLVRITTSTTDITSLAKNIAAQTGLKYSLNMQNASLRKTITLRPGNYRLAQVLEQIKKQAALQYKIVGTHILFIDYSAGSSHTAASPGTIKKQHLLPVAKHPSAIAKATHTKVTSSSAKASAKAIETREMPSLTDSKAKNDSADISAVSSVVKIDVARDTLITSQLVAKDSIHAIAAQPPVKDTIPAVPVEQVTKKVAATTPPKAAAAANNTPASPKNGSKWIQPWVRAGVTADELFYAGAQVQAGLKWLYGIAAYGTSFSANNFRWGGGLSLRLNETQRIQLNYTTGKAAKEFYVADTTHHTNVSLKESLNRVGVAWSNDFSNRWSLQVQVYYNMLHQSFATVAIDSTSAGLDAFKGDFDKQYSIFEPPYTTRKTVNDRSADKSWIGIQLSLLFKIF